MIRRRAVAAIIPIACLVVWPVGVLLLWRSLHWTARDKLLGIVVLPGGLWPAWLIATGVRTSCQSAGGQPIETGAPGCPAPLAYQITHPTSSWAFNHVFGPIVLILMVALPILAATYLEVRLARRTA